MAKPFFVMGAERAGLLLVELLLAAHPNLDWGGDFDYAVDWDEPELGDWPPLVPYWGRLSLCPRVRALRLAIDPSLGFPELVRSLLDQQQARSQAVRFGLSVHGDYDRLLRLFPEADFIYVGRSGGRAGAEPSAGLALRESDRLWRTISAQIAPRNRLELRYEQLVASPASELARVCELLGVKFERRLIREAVSLRAPSEQAREESPSPGPRRRLAAAFGQRVAQLLEERGR